MATTIDTRPQRVDYILVNGDTWTPGTITVNFGGTIVNGAVGGGTYPDLTTYTARIRIRQALSGTVLKTLSSPSSGITLSNAGVITPSMTKVETAALALGEYLYDLEMTYPDSTEITYTCGRLSVTFDSSLIGQGATNYNLVLNTAAPVILVLGFGANYNSYVDALPEYDSDESAIADGLAVGDIYKTADNHISLPGGLQKQIREI